jgi:ketosteroid isomerase-like protein
VDQGQGPTRASAEAQRLRELIERLQREQRPPPISDDVFVASGGFPGPLRGAAALRAASAAQRATRRNPSRTATVERLEVAAGGDLAFEYGTQRLEWDTLAGEHRTVDAAYLAVWRQDAGEWRLAARIAHPITPDA